MTPVPEHAGPAGGEETIELTCLLMRSLGEGIRIVVGDLCLTIHEDDIRDATEITSPEGITYHLALPVRMTLGKPFRVLDVTSGAIYDDVLYTGHRPYAIAARPGPVTRPPAPEYDRLEHAFLLAHGIDPDHDPDPDRRG